MSTYKRVSGDYTIQSVNTTDRIFINSGNVFIEGNLWVSGNTQTVSSTNMELNNNQLVLNAGATVPNPAGATIYVARGTGNSNSAIIWNETLQVWQISEVINGSFATANISTSSSTGNYITGLYGDTNPTLSANLNLNGHTIFDSNANVTMFANVVGGGGTGIHVSNSTYANVELMNKTKSIVYSIIFG